MASVNQTYAPEIEVAQQVREHPFLEFQGLANGTWFVFAIVSVASAKVSRIFPRIGLPLITGYLCFGCLCGPNILNMITPVEIPDLAYITQIALSFIAFSAGSELYLPELRSLFRVILMITGLNALYTYVLMTFFIYLLAAGGVIGWMGDYIGGCAFTISLVAASIMVARSPASAIAVVRELRAKGPVTSTMLGVTVVGDVVVLILFTLSTSFAMAICSGDGFEGGEFLITLLTLVVAVGIGYALGGFLIFLLWIPQVPAKYTIIPIGFLTFVLCDWFAAWSIDRLGVALNFDALLICITAGYVVTNQSRNRVAFLNLLGSASTYIFIPFFTKVGVELNLPVFFQSLGFAILVFLGRVGCVFLGSYTGARLAGMDQYKQKTLWMTMLAQAGVSLGLASEVRARFPTWGPMFQTSIIAVVLINQFAGPVACKWALRANGEAGKMIEGEDEHERGGHEGPKKVKRGVIIGVDPVSLSVAQRLLHSSWAVTLLDTNQEQLNLKKKLVVALPDLGLSEAELAAAEHRKESAKTADVEDPEKSKTGLLSEDESGDSAAEPKPVSSFAAADAGGASAANFSVPGSSSFEPRLVAKLIPESNQADYVMTIDRLLADSQFSILTAAVVQMETDEQTYAVATHLLEARHVPKVLARLHNPAWASQFIEHGISPFYANSSSAHIIYKGITAMNPVFASDVDPMHKALGTFIEAEDDLGFALSPLAPSERAEFETHYPPPSVAALERMKDIAKLRLNTVTMSQRDTYMENLLKTHDHEYKFDDRETADEVAMMLGPSGRAQKDVATKEAKKLAGDSESESESSAPQSHIYG